MIVIGTKDAKGIKDTEGMASCIRIITSFGAETKEAKTRTFEGKFIIGSTISLVVSLITSCIASSSITMLGAIVSIGVTVSTGVSATVRFVMEV